MMMKFVLSVGYEAASEFVFAASRACCHTALMFGGKRPLFFQKLKAEAPLIEL